MATFSEHIVQAKKNIEFLARINSHCRTYIDWQTTVCFYTALHLINAHVVKKTSQNYRTHAQVDSVINPYHRNPSPAALSPETYLQYNQIKNLSRRARYLISHEDTVTEHRAYLMKEKHFVRSVGLLDKIVGYISREHGITIEKTAIDCEGLKKYSCAYFTHLGSVAK